MRSQQAFGGLVCSIMAGTMISLYRAVNFSLRPLKKLQLIYSLIDSFPIFQVIFIQVFGQFDVPINVHVNHFKYFKIIKIWKFIIITPIDQPTPLLLLTLMYRQPEMCRKKSAFRQRLRKEYIQNLFKTRRQQLQIQLFKTTNDQHNNIQSPQKNNNNREHIKQLSEFKINDSIVKSNRNCYSAVNYPYISNCIPVVQLFGNEYMDSESVQINREKNIGKIRQFVSYEHFVQYIEGLVKSLPRSIYSMVSLFNNNPQLITQFLKYLFTPSPSTTSKPQYKNLHSLTQKLAQTTPSQYTNYLHILQSLLIHLQQSSEPRITIITTITQKITNRVFNILQVNKMMKVQVLKVYFDYLVTLGNDVRVLKNTEIFMVLDCVKDAFGGCYSQDQEYRCHQLYDSVILVCNMVISLGSHALAEQGVAYLDAVYQTQTLKQFFLNQLLQSPKTLKNMASLAITPQTNTQLQHILRFFINLTFLINQPTIMHQFMDALIVLVRTVLAQYKIYGQLYIINMLVLRLVNNITVNDGYSAQALWDHGVIGKIVDIFGFWCLDGLGVLDHQKQYENSINRSQNSNYEDPQTKVLTQFLSTITTYIIMLNNEPQQSPTRYYINNLTQLIETKYIHLIILQCLTLSSIVGGQSELVIKCLEALLVLANYQVNCGGVRVGRGDDGVCRRLLGYGQLLRNVIDRTDNQNIVALCQQLLEIVKNQQQKIEQQRISQQQHRKHQQMYDEYMKQINQQTVDNPTNHE